MKIVLAPDSFKGTLTSAQVCQALADGIWGKLPNAGIIPIPIADGGEGTVESLARANPDCQRYEFSVTGPNRVPVQAVIIKLAESKTIALDMASASGLLLVPPQERNPFDATTYGTGELIRISLEQFDAQNLIIGLGGSATNDAGAGSLQALGFQLFDSSNNLIPVPALPRALKQVNKIDDSKVLESILSAHITLACDVDNPLTGRRGASRVFGPQKGATPDMVEELEGILLHFGTVLDDYCISHGREPISTKPGAGAAGGLGAGLMAAFGNCEVKSGIDIVLDYGNFDDALIGADLVITGEGRLDSQTLGGKAVTGVLKRARNAGIPVVIVAGSAEPDTIQQMLGQGVQRVIQLAEIAGSVEEAIADAARYVQLAGEMAVSNMAC